VVGVTDRDELLALIKELAVVHGEVTLSSGLKADYYIDLRRITLHRRAAPLVGRVMLELTADWDYQAAGGLTLGADPVGAAIMHTSNGTVDAFVVRKADKAHGMQQRIEGPSVAGRRVLAVEDVSTTGSSPLTAIEALAAAGAEVVGAALIVDRGGAQRIREAGYECRAAFSLADLGLS
jgi:orotate phosphoribosyltransferase